MSASVQQSPPPPVQNLWDIAVTKLSDKEKTHLDLSSSAKLDELLSAVKSRMQECEQRQWIVKKVVLRDVFTKIAKWFEKFIEIGDVAVQYDPGHAALPWAAVRFLLTVSIQDINQYALVVEGVEKITNIMTQYRIVERLYLVKRYEATAQLENHITDLYALVMKFLVKAKKYYQKNTAIRALKNMTDFNNKLQGYMESIGKKDQETRRYTALLDAEYRESFGEGLAALSSDEQNKHQHLKDVLDNLQMPIDRIERDLQDMRDDLGDAKRIQILQWISPIPYEQHHNQARRDLMAGTGLWFLNDERLLGWRGSSTSSIMWLRGIAGSGKSKLISIFIEQQLSEFRERKNPNPIYFYCTRNPAEPERSKPDAILRSLVRQLSVRSSHEAIPESVRKMYKARENDAFVAGLLTLEESTALIIELSQYRQLTTIIVDALDECEEVLRLELLESFKEILQRSNGLVKILVSSRDVGDIVYQLDGCLNLEIQASMNQGDIDLFVNRGVDTLIKSGQLLRGKISDDLRQEIEQVLREKAGGMFRWVSLQLDFLRGLKYEPAVRSRLRQLPKKLLQLYNETYSQTLESQAEEEQTLTKNALRMLLCLQTPLRTGDFMLALCSCEEASLSAEDLLDLCSSFVVLDKGLDIFRFAHLSVREFLETQDAYEPDRNHALMAELCLKYLSSSFVTEGVTFWNSGHAGSEQGPGKDNPSSLVLVHKHPSKAPASRKMTANGVRCNSCGQLIQGVSWDCVMLEGVNRDFCANCVEKGMICMDEDHCPLVNFLEYGNSHTLMTKDVYDDEREDWSLSPVPIFLNGFHQYSCLYWPFHLSASMNHRLSTPLQTISLGFMIGGQQTPSASFVSWSNTIWKSSRFPFQDRTWGYDLLTDPTVLLGASQPADCIFIAAIWEFCDILELRIGIDPEAVHNVSQLVGSTALHLASVYGSVKAAQILLKKGTKLEERNRDDYTALGLAVETQQSEIVSLLLKRGADARTKQCGCSLLEKAVRKGHMAIIQLLLEHGVAPDFRSTMSDPALTFVAAKGNEEMMKLLLSDPTSIDSSNKLLWRMVTRIQKVMHTEGEAGLMQSLSTWPTGTTANQFLGTVLWRAVQRKDEDCARLLLAKGADPNIVFENRSVFDVATRPLFKGDKGYLKFIEMLLDHGAKPSFKRIGRIGKKLLMAWGIDSNTMNLVRVVADDGIDLNENPLFDGSPLFRAVENRNVEIVKFLLERGSDPKEVSDEFFSGNLKPRDPSRHSPQGSEEIGNLLLAYGATLEVVENASRDETDTCQ